MAKARKKQHQKKAIQIAHSTASDTESASEPKSTLYVLGSATMAAAILGLTLFLLVRGFQWQVALEALHAEPGIELLSVERAGFFKKRLRGLRDPLAPSVESILIQHNIGPWSAEILFSEYHSLDTPYARQREEQEKARYEGLRDSLLTAVGQFTDTIAKQREDELVKITRMLFAVSFPEAMKTVSLDRDDNGVWHVTGELYAPERQAFIKEAPSRIVEGELNFDGLIDLTASRTALLRKQIEEPDLLTLDLDEKPVHPERLVRLVQDYDAVCERSGLAKPHLQLSLRSADPLKEQPQLAAIRAALTSPDRLPAQRFLTDEILTLPSGPPKLSLKLHSAVSAP